MHSVTSPGGIAFDSTDQVGGVDFAQSGNPGRNLFNARGQTVCRCRVFLVSGPAIDNLPAVLQLGRYDRLRQGQRMRGIRNRPIQRHPQVNVAAGRSPNDKPNRSAHLQRSDPDAALHARLQGLAGDLPAAQHDDRIDGFQGNPLTAFGRGNQK